MNPLEVYHYSLCPFSRKLRIILKEKGVSFELFHEPYWQRRKSFLKMNPACETPVVLIGDKVTLSGNTSITEYLEEVYTQKRLLPTDLNARARVRRITEWFDNKFYHEVTRYILNEKIIKTVSRQGYPNSQAIQAAKNNINYHLDYIAYLRKENAYLCGEEATIADIAAAAQLSVLDYVGDVPWGYNKSAKEWYALVKSRPSFKAILNDRIPNIAPPSHYQDPDF
ncbi:MAG: glutathione S-transferase family protein [Candidatus Jidaibacter sp.]|jgi:glutathione S-transferase|nr:glutathione S-transferase family protein [Candidatus Jidaibacter sp.]